MYLVAYHSNLYFDAFKLHVEEIKSKGFDTVLFCITETDLLYNLETFHEFRVYAESQELNCWATFWGLFAGEAIISDRLKTYTLMSEWSLEIFKIGFRHIMIDEAKDLSFVKYWTCLKMFDFHLCLTNDTFNKLSDEEIINLPVKSLGVSNYHWVKDWQKITIRSQRIAARLNRLRPDDNFVFLQGFDIPDGWELIPVVVKEVCEINGIKNFGFWSFRATEGTASKRPVNHKYIWKSINFKE